MSAGDPSGLLRLALRLDAVATAALALVAIVAAPALGQLLGAPAGLLGPLGLGLLAYAVAIPFALTAWTRTYQVPWGRLSPRVNA